MFGELRRHVRTPRLVFLCATHFIGEVHYKRWRSEIGALSEGKIAISLEARLINKTRYGHVMWMLDSIDPKNRSSGTEERTGTRALSQLGKRVS